MNFEAGEIVTLNEEEYVIVSVLKCNKTTYFYLTTLTKPIRVVLARQLNEFTLETLTSQDEIDYLLTRFNNSL